jgi:hypothetical protein
MSETSKEVGHVRGSDLIFSAQSFETMDRLANLMASGKVQTPKHFQGNPADCFAVILQAMQWQMNPFVVAQKTHVVNGVLGYEAQLVNAVIESSGVTKGRLKFRWDGNWDKILGNMKELESKTKKDDAGNPVKFRAPNWNINDEIGLSVTVTATLRGDDEPTELTLKLTQVRTRNSTLWAEDPKQQIAYLATKKWARLNCPDVILGVYSADELADDDQPEKVINPSPADAAKPDSLPPMEDAKFNSNFPTYEKGIQSGKNTPEQVIAKISSKYSLSQSQIDSINAVKPAIEGELVNES